MFQFLSLNLAVSEDQFADIKIMDRWL